MKCPTEHDIELGSQTVEIIERQVRGGIALEIQHARFKAVYQHNLICHCLCPFCQEVRGLHLRKNYD